MSRWPEERNSPTIWYPYGVALRNAERLIKLISWNLHMWQVVGEIRRGEKHVRSIEIVIVPRRSRLDVLKRALKRTCSGFDNARENVWTMTFECLAVVVYLASRENFRILEFLKTGPNDFVREFLRVACEKGFVLGQRGLKRNDTGVVLKLESEIFQKLGLPYLKPRQRHLLKC